MYCQGPTHGYIRASTGPGDGPYPPSGPGRSPAEPSLVWTLQWDPGIDLGTSYWDPENVLYLRYFRVPKGIARVQPVPNSAKQCQNSVKTAQNSHILRCTLRFTRPNEGVSRGLGTHGNVYPHGMVPQTGPRNGQIRPSVLQLVDSRITVRCMESGTHI